MTGPARGLGLAISKRLVAEGFRVLGVSRSITAEYEELMGAAPVGAACFKAADLSDLRAIPSLVSGLVREAGPLYGLVNNSAIGVDGVLATLHGSEIAKLLRLNLESPIVLTKYACRSMLARGEGRIVCITSIVASTGFSGLSVYAASKAGLEGFARSLSRELGRAAITVNCVAPGFMETAMTSGLDEERLSTIRRRSPLGMATVADAAGAVAYLLSPDAARVTGTVVTVDGGSSA